MAGAIEGVVEASPARPIFDGVSLAGWHAVPRSYGTVWPGGPTVAELVADFPGDYAQQAQAHPAVWSVVDGAIVGQQDPSHPGYGGYLVSDATYGDFDLQLEMKPDWPADTGVMIRRRAHDWAGFQVLVDHRASGSIGGFYGNGLGGFHAVPFALDAARDENGRPTGLTEDNPATSQEPVTPDKMAMLGRRGQVAEFLRHWRWGDWNTLRVRCIGELPVITTWVNDDLIAEIDTATIDHPHYDPDVVLRTLGPRGHLALEVHDNDPVLGSERWAPGSKCRWRNLTIRDLTITGADR